MLPMIRSRFTTPTLFEPWNDLRREIDRIFDSVLSGLPLDMEGRSHYLPAMDVEETNDKIRLTLEAPGVSPEDIEIAVQDNMLTISGEKRVHRESGSDRDSSHVIERRYGRFERSMMLPENVNADSISAHFENGVLTVELPKTPDSRRRLIPIGIGGREKEQAR